MQLLEIVQNVMSSMSLEEVNSMEEVPESIQIAEIVKETYYEILAHREWEFLNETFSMQSSGDLSAPTKMVIPSTISDVSFVKYFNEKADKYEDVFYVSPEEFLELNNNVNLGDNVDQVTGLTKQLNAIFRIYNDRQPEYYTSFDEKNLVFNAYNKKFDDTLQENKSLCYGTRYSSFVIADDHEIDMPDEMVWSYLLPEVKSVASVNLLQITNVKEEQRSRRGRWRMYHAHPKTTNDYRREVARFGRK